MARKGCEGCFSKSTRQLLLFKAIDQTREQPQKATEPKWSRPQGATSVPCAEFQQIGNILL